MEGASKENKSDCLLTTVHFYIQDHLEHSQLVQTQKSFADECSKLGLPIGKSSKSCPNVATIANREKILEQLVNTFDNALQDEFFELWDNPKCVSHVFTARKFSKINFLLHIYFSCRRIAERVASVSDGLQKVRNFFDHEGASLSSEQEFIHFFALPFVADPQNHPSFKQLFQQTNWLRLRADLITYLQELRISTNSDSALAKLILSCNSTVAESHNEAEAANIKMLKESYANLSASHQTLKKDHQKLIAVTKELTNALEVAARTGIKSGKHFNWADVIQNCSRLYPELFPQASRIKTAGSRGKRSLETPSSEALNRPKSSPNVSRTVIEVEDNEAMEEEERRMTTAPSQQIIKLKVEIVPARLNFSKIKSDITADSRKAAKLLLVQALRWLLTKSSNVERKSAVDAYVGFDLLGFHSNVKQTNNYSKKLLHMIHPDQVQLERQKHVYESNQRLPTVSEEGDDEAVVQQSLLRLINAMASIKTGRDYLGGSSEIVEVLMTCLLSINGSGRIEVITINMIVATLQKLSLKCYVRKQLIAGGIVEWLIHHLDRVQATSSYGLEYSTALFMNLCLHKSGKQKCLPMAKSVLQTFINLLSTESKQILPYVNGTLYSLLSNGRFALAAKDMGMEEKLIEVTEKLSGDGETRRQIEYVLDQLQQSSADATNGPDSVSPTSTSSASTVVSCDENDEEDENDDETIDDDDIDIEEEIDLDDPVHDVEGELSGNDLLHEHYMIDDQSISEQTHDDSHADATNETHINEKIVQREKEIDLEIPYGGVRPNCQPMREEKLDTFRLRDQLVDASGAPDEILDTPRRAPCTFFIRNSPPLPIVPNSKDSDFSSSDGSEEVKDNEEDEVMTITVEEQESSSNAEQTANDDDTKSMHYTEQLQPITKIEQEASPSEDSDEGVVILLVDRKKAEKEIANQIDGDQELILVRSDQTTSQPQRIITSTRLDRTNVGNTVLLTARKNSANRKTYSASRRSKSSSSNEQTTTTELPKLNNGRGSSRGYVPASQFPPVKPTSSPRRNISPTSKPSSAKLKKLPVSTLPVENPLLAAVMTAMPLLPPLPEAMGHEGSQNEGLYKVSKNETWNFQSNQGSSLLEDFTQTNNPTMQDRESYMVTPPSPRKRWKKLTPLPMNGSNLGIAREEFAKLVQTSRV